MTWNSRLILLNVLTDAAVALSYYSIPAALGILAFRKRDGVELRPLLILFALFIAFCGGGHVMDIVSIWHPIYWLKGWWNLGTASTSVITAFVLIPKVADFLRLPATAEKLTRETTRLSEHNLLLNAVQNAISEGIILVNPEGAVLLSNQSAEKILGSPPPEGDARDWIGWRGHQEEESGAVTIPGGRTIERFTTCVPEHGQLYVLRDITERLRSESARRRLDQVIATLKQGFFISSVDTGTILSTNAAFNEMHGYGPAELDGQPTNIIFAGSPEERRDVMAAIRENVAGGSFWEGETRNLRRDGTAFPARLRVNLHREDKAELLSFMVADITEEKDLEEETQRFQAKLLHTQKLESVGLLAGGIAHDFNNLLTGILGNASFVLDLLPPSSRLRDRLRDVVTASERAANLTRQLLAYSGKGRFVLESVDVSALIHEITSLIRLSIPKPISLRLNLRGDLPPVEADSGQLQQLLMNLIINGAEAIGESAGTVTVTTGLRRLHGTQLETLVGEPAVAPGEYICCEVEDTGSGMDKAILAQIFDPFFTTKFTGRGLGLAAALGIVRGHRGALQVESEPGKGTRFRIFLPAMTEVRAEAPPPAENQSLQGRGTVLVVDDEAIVRQIASVALRHYGYEVVLAENGQQAVEIYEANRGKIAAVLLDLMMPVMGGEETLYRLRQIDDDVRVLLTSGFNETEAVRRFGQQRLAGFIQKPYTSSRLAEKVKSVVEGSELS